MVRHVILFKFRASSSPQQRRQAVNMLKDLGSKIPEIREWSVGLQALPSGKTYDMAQVSTFASLDALQQFKLHPEHVKVRNYLASVADWITVDYEFAE